MDRHRRGLAIIASILGILFFIVHEVAPLDASGDGGRASKSRASGRRGARRSDRRVPRARRRRSIADGHVRVARLATGELLGGRGAWSTALSRPNGVSVPPGSTAFVVADDRRTRDRPARRFFGLLRSGPPRRGARRFLRPRSSTSTPQRRPITRAARAGFRRRREPRRRRAPPPTTRWFSSARPRRRTR